MTALHLILCQELEAAALSGAEPMSRWSNSQVGKLSGAAGGGAGGGKERRLTELSHSATGDPPTTQQLVQPSRTS